METSEPNATDARVQESYGWLRAAATGYHNAHRGAAPSVKELIAEGALLMTSLAPRYNVSHGAAFVTFCSPYVLKRWERLRRRALRETPAGGWEEILGLLRTEGHVMQSDPDHFRRVAEVTDLFITAAELDEALDLKRIWSFTDTLPEPQRSLLLGIHRDGRTLSEVSRELGLTRGKARSQLFIGLRALGHQFRDDVPS